MLKTFAAALLLMSSTAQAVGWGEFLRGHWISECKRVGLTRYTQTEYTFSDFTGPEFQIVVQASGEFSDAACLKPIFYHQLLGGLTLKTVAGGSPSGEPVLKGVKVLWQVNSLVRYPIAFYDKRKLAEMNEKAYCGKKDWALGKGVDLLQTSCADEVKDFYAKNWFTMEVVDSAALKLGDKSGTFDQVKRTMFQPPKPHH